MAQTAYVPDIQSRASDPDEACANPNQTPTKVCVEAPVELDAGDIQIGAVELKDAATDTRAKVKTDGTDNAVVVFQNSQPLPTGAATAANQATIITALTATGASASQVQGTAADGAALVGNPVQVAGRDDAGNVQTIRTTTAGDPMITGTVADDAADGGSPVKVGGRAVDPAALPAAVSVNDRVHFLTDLSRLLLTRQVTAGVVTDHSGTVTTGGVAQSLMAANPGRRFLFIQNVSVGSLWINFTTTAVANPPSIHIPTGTSLMFDGSFVSSEAVSIFGATTGWAFVAKQG